MDPDHVDLRIRFPAPDPFHDPLGGDNGSGRAHEQLHHLKFPSAKPFGAVPAAQDALSAVQRQISECNDIGRVSPTSAQHGPHPCKQLVRIERFGQIVVGSCIKTLDTVLFLPFCGQHHHRSGDAFCPQQLQDLDPIHLGEHDVQDHCVVISTGGIVVSGAPIVDRIHDILVLFQKRGQGLRQIQFIFYNQQTHFDHLIHIIRQAPGKTQWFPGARRVSQRAS